MALLVQGKGKAIAAEFDTMLKEPAWLLNVIESAPGCKHTDLVSLAVLMACCNAVGFARRVLWLLQELGP